MINRLFEILEAPLPKFERVFLAILFFLLSLFVLFLLFPSVTFAEECHPTDAECAAGLRAWVTSLCWDTGGGNFMCPFFDFWGGRTCEEIFPWTAMHSVGNYSCQPQYNSEIDGTCIGNYIMTGLACSADQGESPPWPPPPPSPPGCIYNPPCGPYQIQNAYPDCSCVCSDDTLVNYPAPPWSYGPGCFPICVISCENNRFMVNHTFCNCYCNESYVNELRIFNSPNGVSLQGNVTSDWEHDPYSDGVLITKKAVIQWARPGKASVSPSITGILSYFVCDPVTWDCSMTYIKDIVGGVLDMTGLPSQKHYILEYTNLPINCNDLQDYAGQDFYYTFSENEGYGRTDFYGGKKESLKSYGLGWKEWKE